MKSETPRTRCAHVHPGISTILWSLTISIIVLLALAAAQATTLHNFKAKFVESHRIVLVPSTETKLIPVWQPAK